MLARPKGFMFLCLTVAAAVVLSGCVRTTKSAGSKYNARPAPGVNASFGGAEIVALPRRKPPVPARATARALARKPGVLQVVEKTGAGRSAAAAPAPQPRSAGVYYVTVKDTLYSISRRFHVPLRSLIDANGLKPPYTLRIGQKLSLPKPRSYTVVKGDTVYGISRRHGVDMSELMRLNGIKPPYTIAVGQTLRVPDPSSPPSQVATASLIPNGSAAAAKPPRPAPTASQAPAPASPQTATSNPQPTAATPAQAVPVAATTGPVPSPPPRSGSKFLWPVQGKVVSGFGAKGKGYHNDGINILAPRGTEIRAADNGVIAYAGNELRGFGNLVLVKHAGGWTTAYAHTDQILVRRGQTVKRGQLIARVGSSGNVAQPQLHFEIRKGARAVDPTRLLGPEDAKL